MTPEVIFGPPGTGKTTALMEEVAGELRRGTSPERVGYVSFTRRAAEEARDRAFVGLGLFPDSAPWFRTLHSMCFSRLGLRSGDVLGEQAVQDFASWAGIEVQASRWGEDGLYQGYTEGERCLFMDQVARLRGVTLREQYDSDDDDLSWVEVSRVSRALAEFKKKRGLLDYTDMLHQFAASGRPPRLDVLCIDEVQDLSPLQHRVADLLGRGCRRVIAAGDDDQAIYQWAGADPAYMVSMAGGRARVLGESHRVPRRVQAVAQAIIGRVPRRQPKTWRPRQGTEGQVLRAPDLQSLDWGDGSVLVLARNRYVLEQQVEPELRAQGLVYDWGGRPSLDPLMMSAVRGWETLRRGESVPSSLAQRIYDWLTPGLGAWAGGHEDQEIFMFDLERDHGLRTRAPWYEALGRLPREDVGYIRAARRRGESLTQPRVRLSTIHGSKGGEADHVVLCSEVAKRTWDELERDPEGEARVWYVGVTRARERLTVVESQTGRECPWL